MKMESSWRFDTPGPMPMEAVRAFDTLTDRVVAQGNRWSMLEHFKGHFGGSGRSSSENWAQSDLNDLMRYTAENALLFIEAFYEACEALRGDGSIALPDVGRMNRILREHGVGYEIKPPDLIAVGLHQPIAVPERDRYFICRTRKCLTRDTISETTVTLNEGIGAIDNLRMSRREHCEPECHKKLEMRSARVATYFLQVIGRTTASSR
ncbi:hypothetical protein E0H35_30485 [Rhizobium leguminosarum bv. viciae]|uniref:hypothetical protein n=1 Tax=Rhizobium leguminosarum TaxID=384 RepID=UPI00103DFDDB|nr:hypothetical protein [Rhizobium leguminosarum]MBY5340422.1 hypothetical protein [Rhizobium leguminosarum]NKK49322.1 hypothetical protein [Rhizobium leguminosarum bv. viciae]TBY90862.1 hypothetical protein E0H35_30485 [Rhizobium leguminosarum bv. viciae]